MQKQLNYRVFVMVNGVKTPWEEIPEERQKEIAEKLNDNALRAVGYIRKDESNENDKTEP